MRPFKSWLDKMIELASGRYDGRRLPIGLR
jgi:hypothetical protein